jgi:hypothetical protein
MITDILTDYFGDAFFCALSLLPLIQVVRMGDEKIIAELPCSVNDFIKQHNLRFMEV